LYLSQIDSALIDFNNIQKQFPDNVPIYKYLAMAYSVKYDSANARKYFRQSINHNPNDPETYFYWANMELYYGNYSKAVELLETAMKNPEPEPSFDAYYRLGLAKAGTRDTLGAVAAFNKAVAKDSNRYELYELRATFLVGDMRYKDQLIKDYTSMIRLIGDTNALTSSLLYEQRSFLKFASSDSLGTRADINKAIELFPNEPNYYVIRAGFNFYLTDNKELMLKDLDKAISLDNSTWEAYIWKAGIYERYKINNKYIDSDFTKACENLKKGIKNGAKVSTVIENYICKGKLPKDGVIPDMFFCLTPKFKSQGLKGIKKGKL
jgi:tetratricopeptide (TPR) repeat protein